MNILLIDSDPVAVKTITGLLQVEGFRVTSATTAAQARMLLRARSFDLIMLELILPDASGMHFGHTLAELAPGAAVIYVTSRATRDSMLMALNQGADDFIAKPFDPHELAARVKAVLRRTTRSLRPRHRIVGDLALGINDLKVVIAGRKTVLLTPTEVKLLECLMENAGRVLTREELLEAALGYTHMGASNSIDVYIRRLRKKIEDDPANPIYIETVRGMGYTLRRDSTVPAVRTAQIALGMAAIGFEASHASQLVAAGR